MKCNGKPAAPWFSDLAVQPTNSQWSAAMVTNSNLNLNFLFFLFSLIRLPSELNHQFIELAKLDTKPTRVKPVPGPVFHLADPVLTIARSKPADRQLGSTVQFRPS